MSQSLLSSATGVDLRYARPILEASIHSSVNPSAPVAQSAAQNPLILGAADDDMGLPFEANA
jgi:hypothetical protein